MTDNVSARDAVVIERSFDAPAHVIWQMWTEPEYLKAWYGPDGVTIAAAKMDVRVGGIRLIGMEMETPGGLMQMWFTGEYREVVADRRLVYTESISDGDGNIVPPSDMGLPEGHPTTTEVTVELHPEGDRTRMVMTHAGISEDSPGAGGWTMAFAKLAAYVDAQYVR